MDVPNDALLLKQARTLFYQSIEDEDLVEQAEQAFRRLGERNKQHEGRATTYLGALTAIRGKHAFWPHDKWRLANEGIAQMDRGVALAPDDVEALFIHGSTCYYLPFFFNRADDAQKKFRRIVRLLPMQKDLYDPELLRNVVNFLAEHAELGAGERRQLEEVRKTLATTAPGSGSQ